MKLMWVAIAAVTLLVGVACGDDDGDTDAAQETPASTAVANIDPALLAAVVLNGEDEPGLQISGGFSPSDPSVQGRAFTSYLTNETLLIQSTVVRYETELAASEDFQRNRQVLPTFGATEENFELEGVEIAFLYRIRTGPGTAMWAIVDNYVIYIQMSPIDPEAGPEPAAVDVERLRRYATTVVSRLNRLIEDPSSVTPVPASQFGQEEAPTTTAIDSTPPATP